MQFRRRKGAPSWVKSSNEVVEGMDGGHQLCPYSFERNVCKQRGGEKIERKKKE